MEGSFGALGLVCQLVRAACYSAVLSGTAS
jgi:hypothetical protein